MHLQNKNLPIENTTDCLSTMASVCRVMLETPWVLTDPFPFDNIVITAISKHSRTEQVCKGKVGTVCLEVSIIDTWAKQVAASWEAEQLFWLLGSGVGEQELQSPSVILLTLILPS